jgi:valyl-tRNA synthetase
MWLVQDIVKVQNISYLSAWQEIEGDREIAMIMDIKVWLKGIKEINKKELLQDLELQLAQEQQFLQTLRNLFTWDFASRAPSNVVEEKKLKMDEMKTKVANIEGEIRRLKMEVK